MDSIKLRTLTLKSTLGFGKHSRLTIERLLKTNPTYIIWVYYCCSKITFVENILHQLGIVSKYRIKKPGVDKEMRLKFLHEIVNDNGNKPFQNYNTVYLQNKNPVVIRI